tara:strand:+ start:114 stop:320 length:207 start_codon:yes stop_codon:yes gene_type:complete
MSKELADLRKKNLEKLDAELVSARESQFGLRIKHRTGQLNETSELKKVRKKIAQIKTVIKEIKLKDEK